MTKYRIHRERALRAAARLLALLMLAALLLAAPALCEEEKTAVPSLRAPDYADPADWAYFAVGEEKEADLFLICPAVDTRDETNMSLDDEKTKAKFVGALNMERGIYEDSARMYAPYYRSVAIGVYSLAPEDREPYLALAYSDVSAAFSWYLAHENGGRPIILAGFSQGADMCLRLMEEYFGDEDLLARLVAVYAPGWPLSASLTESCPQIRPAAGEFDTGTVISFDCEAPDLGETFINPAGEKALSINPLNWRTDSFPAGKEMNLGACFTDYSGSVLREEPALCGCWIDPERGVLKVPDVRAEDYPPVVAGLPEGSYHVYDYQFFFRNLQQNVRDRLARFLTLSADPAA